MCGILATINRYDTKDDFTKATLDMAYRGPDKSGCYWEMDHGRIKLGHNRLAIIDLDQRSNQPFISSDGNYCITYNGEIYNHLELVKKYNLTLRTKSDTELILELYIQKGANSLQDLIGMFAFVIVNTKTGDFFVARDRLGIKPIFFWQREDQWIFSSEPISILKLIKNFSINEYAIRQYYNMRTLFNGATFFNEIKVFPAGSYLHGDTFVKYWNFPEGEQNDPKDDEIYELLTSAVKYRMVSDVPVGAFISGGLDSSIVAYLSQATDLWTVGTKTSNEFQWAKELSNYLGRTYHEKIVDEVKYNDYVREMIGIRFEALSVPNEVLLYKLSQQAAKVNKVILCGEGADELFFGYSRIFRWAAQAKNFDLVEFAKLYCYTNAPDLEILEDVIQPFLRYEKPLLIVGAFFQIGHLHGLLRRLDFASMAAGVETRVPFTDHRLVERMAGVSYEYRTKNNIIKAPLKRIFANLLPASIVNREKVGFPVDLKSIYTKGIEASPQLPKSDMQEWFNYNIIEFNKIISSRKFL